MADPPGRPPPVEDEDPELGPPITAELERLEAALPVSGSFLERLERRIERRQVAADLGRLWWEVPSVVVKALLRGALSPGRRAARRRPPPEGPAPIPTGTGPVSHGKEEGEHG